MGPGLPAPTNLFCMENYELLARIKHETGTKLLGISSALRNIDTAIKKNGLENLMISEKHGLSVSDAISQALKTLWDIHEVYNDYETKIK